MSATTEEPGTLDTLRRDVRWLTDRAEISDLICSYGRKLDTQEWDGFATLFTSDAALVMPWEGDGAGVVGADKLAEFCEAGLARFPQTQHMLTNFQIEVDGDAATSTHYLQAAHIRNTSDPQGHWDVAGWYHAHYARTADGWRFTRVELEAVWQSGGVGDLDGDWR
jgi:hypothetical protein